MTQVESNNNRRFLLNVKAGSYEVLDYDVVVIGSGIAGIYAALNLNKRLKVAIITKGDIGSGNSFYAQGGIAAVMSASDSYNLHIEDTLNAGAGLCDIEAVRVLVNEGPENIRRLVEMNVPFDVNSEGELMITREGGHRQRRIVHCGGDATGRETTTRLCQIAAEQENLTFFANTFLTDIITEENRVTGVMASGKVSYLFNTGNLILAAGGIGQIYNYTTNPRGSVGDGIAAAYRSGAVIENMEMVQFHPTTLIPHYESERTFLISEAVRGEGGILKNRHDEAFMQSSHPMADLAPRDIVTRAIYKELKRTGDPYVYLDVSSMTEDFFVHRFPTIYNECKKFNINIPKDRIPVRPAQHYHMGGIKTNLDGMTNIGGLYACGETASTGIHGANRLASNSMLECLVFGRRCANHINGSFIENSQKTSFNNITINENTLNSNQVTGFKTEVKTIMSLYVGALRKVRDMLFALERLEKIIGFLEGMTYQSQECIELYNMVQVALMVVTSAIMRRDNIGAHYVEE